QLRYGPGFRQADRLRPTVATAPADRLRRTGDRSVSAPDRRKEHHPAGSPGGLEYRAHPHPRSGADGTRRLAVDVRDPPPAPAVRGSATTSRPGPGHDAPPGA